MDLTTAGEKGITSKGSPKLPQELGLNEDEYSDLCLAWFNGSQLRRPPMYDQDHPGTQLSILMREEDLADIECVRVVGSGYRITKIGITSGLLTKQVRPGMFLDLPSHDESVSLKDRLGQERLNDHTAYLNVSLSLNQAIETIHDLVSNVKYSCGAFQLLHTALRDKPFADRPLTIISEQLEKQATLTRIMVHDNNAARNHVNNLQELETAFANRIDPRPKPLTGFQTLYIYTDGSAKDGRAGSGDVVYDRSATEPGARVLHRFHRAVPGMASNDDAEQQAFRDAQLQGSLTNTLVIITDSQSTMITFEEDRERDHVPKDSIAYNFRICGLKMERRRRAAGLTPTKVLYTKAHNGELTDPGNVEADKEAEKGRKMHPKLPRLQQLLHAPGYFLAYKSAAFTGQGIKKLFLQIKEEEALRTACGRHAFVALPFIDKKLSVKLFQRPEFKRSRSQRLRALQVNATETVSRMVRPSTEAVRCDRCGDIIKNDRIKNGKKRDFVGHLYYCEEAGQVQGLIRACTAAIQKDHGVTVECTDSFQIDMSNGPPIKKGIVHIDMIRGLFFKDFKQTVAKLVQKDAEQGNRSQQGSLKVDELMKDISEDISEIVRISYAHLTEPFRLWKSKHLPMEFQTQTLKESQLKQMRTALPQHDRQAPTPWPNRMTYSRSEKDGCSDSDDSSSSSSGRDMEFDSGDEALYEAMAMQTRESGHEDGAGTDHDNEDGSGEPSNENEGCSQQ